MTLIGGNIKKNAYALKTPLPVVFLSFLLLPGSQKSMECPNAHGMSMECPNVTLWHWPFTYDRDLQTWPQHPSIWPPYQNSRLYICPFGWGSETDSRPDTHRETHNVKTITPITSETWGVMIASSRQKEASFSLLVGTTHFWMGFYVPWVWEFSEVAAAWAIVHHFHKISKFFLSDP